MNTLTLHPGQINQFFRNPEGPIGRDLDRRMRKVARLAEINFTGAVLQVQSGNLRDNFDAEVFPEADGLVAIIGTTALNVDRFGYPRFHDREKTGGKGWLTSALAEGYR